MAGEHPSKPPDEAARQKSRPEAERKFSPSYMESDLVVSATLTSPIATNQEKRVDEEESKHSTTMKKAIAQITLSMQREPQRSQHLELIRDQQVEKCKVMARLAMEIADFNLPVEQETKGMEFRQRNVQGTKTDSESSNASILGGTMAAPLHAKVFDERSLSHEERCMKTMMVATSHVAEAIQEQGREETGYANTPAGQQEVKRLVNLMDSQIETDLLQGVQAESNMSLVAEDNVIHRQKAAAAPRQEEWKNKAMTANSVDGRHINFAGEVHQPRYRSHRTISPNQERSFPPTAEQFASMQAMQQSETKPRSMADNVLGGGQRINGQRRFQSLADQLTSMRAMQQRGTYTDPHWQLHNSVERQSKRPQEVLVNEQQSFQPMASQLASMQAMHQTGACANPACRHPDHLLQRQPIHPQEAMHNEQRFHPMAEKLAAMQQTGTCASSSFNYTNHSQRQLLFSNLSNSPTGNTQGTVVNAGAQSPNAYFNNNIAQLSNYATASPTYPEIINVASASPLLSHRSSLSPESPFSKSARSSPSPYRSTAYCVSSPEQFVSRSRIRSYSTSPSNLPLTPQSTGSRMRSYSTSPSTGTPSPCGSFHLENDVLIMDGVVVEKQHLFQPTCSGSTPPEQNVAGNSTLEASRLGPCPSSVFPDKPDTRGSRGTRSCMKVDAKELLKDDTGTLQQYARAFSIFKKLNQVMKAMRDRQALGSSSNSASNILNGETAPSLPSHPESVAEGVAPSSNPQHTKNVDPPSICRMSSLTPKNVEVAPAYVPAESNASLSKSTVEGAPRSLHADTPTPTSNEVKDISTSRAHSPAKAPTWLNVDAPMFLPKRSILAPEKETGPVVPLTRAGPSRGKTFLTAEVPPFSLAMKPKRAGETSQPAESIHPIPARVEAAANKAPRSSFADIVCSHLQNLSPLDAQRLLNGVPMPNESLTLSASRVKTPDELSQEMDEGVTSVLLPRRKERLPAFEKICPSSSIDDN